VDGKRNEITAVPVMLDGLDLKGCIEIEYAMGRQRDIAAGTVAAGADYILALKGQQGKLHEQVAAFIDGMIAGGLESYSTAYSGTERSNNGVAGDGHGAVPRSGVSTTLPYVAHH
jgi:hypothetical protein